MPGTICSEAPRAKCPSGMMPQDYCPSGKDDSRLLRNRQSGNNSAISTVHNEAETGDATHCSLVVHEDNHDELFYPNGDPEKFHIIELDRFALNPEALYTVQGTARRKLAPPLYRWLRFFTQGADIHFMEKYKETDVAIKEAKADYESFLTDAQLREAQFEHEMFLHDQAQAKSDAHKEGYEEGMERGIATGMEQGIATGTERGEQIGRAHV